MGLNFQKKMFHSILLEMTRNSDFHAGPAVIESQVVDPRCRWVWVGVGGYGWVRVWWVSSESTFILNNITMSPPYHSYHVNRLTATNAFVPTQTRL